MVIALLGILGVELTVLAVSLAFVLARKRRGNRQLIPIDSASEHRPAAPGDVKRLGSDPTIVLLKADTATVEIAVHSDAQDRVSGPFRHAEARHV